MSDILLDKVFEIKSDLSETSNKVKGLEKDLENSTFRLENANEKLSEMELAVKSLDESLRIFADTKDGRFEQIRDDLRALEARLERITGKYEGRFADKETTVNVDAKTSIDGNVEGDVAGGSITKE